MDWLDLDDQAAPGDVYDLDGLRALDPGPDVTMVVGGDATRRTVELFIASDSYQGTQIVIEVRCDGDALALRFVLSALPKKQPVKVCCRLPKPQRRLLRSTCNALRNERGDVLL